MQKLTLKHPLKLGEKTTITELNFRGYTTAADYLSFDKRGGVAQRIALIASLTGSDESIIMQLRGADYRRAESIADKMLADDEDGTETDASELPREKTEAELAAEKK